MDLIGHDTNFAVTESVFAANFVDKRYVPSLVQREMVDGGLLGRKSGRGFFTYGDADGGARRRRRSSRRRCPPGAIVALHGRGVAVDRWAARLGAGRGAFESDPSSRWNGLQTANGELRLTDGRAGAQVAAEEGVRDLAAVRPGRPRPAAARPGRRWRWRSRPSASAAWRDAGRRLAAHRRLAAAAASATRPAWSSRAPSRCSSTKPATRCCRACARPRAPTWR